MGHLLSAKSSLVPLIGRLNRYPIGLVDSEKLRDILGLLFDNREAFVASRFPLMEATVEELCGDHVLLPAQEGAYGAILQKGRSGGGHLHGSRRGRTLPGAPWVRRGAHCRADAPDPGLRALPGPYPCHRQCPGAAVVSMQLLPLLLRADGGCPDGVPRWSGQDAIHRRGRSGAVRLLRRVPACLQRQVRRAGCGCSGRRAGLCPSSRRVSSDAGAGLLCAGNSPSNPYPECRADKRSASAISPRSKPK